MRRPSESDYRVVLGELRELRQLVRALAPRPVEPGKTFGELAQDWLERIGPLRSDGGWGDRRHVFHLRALSDLREGELTKGAIDDALVGLTKPTGPLGPPTLNKLRSTGRLIVRDAQGNGEWGGINPFDLVVRQRQVRRVYNTLSLEEVARVLPWLRADRRREAKVGLLVGMRPGEVLGLRKVDVDLKGGLLVVRRSHGRNQTKTGKERRFPIPDELLVDLVEAISLSPSEYVFPGAGGARQRADTKLYRVLRTALKKARVVTGYRYHCRRKGCGHKQEELDEVEGTRCPDCNFKLWCEPVPKRVRYYDLRHSSATLHRKAKCDPLVIQEMLGHASGNTTDSTYTHLDDDYRRVELNRLKLPP